MPSLPPAPSVPWNHRLAPGFVASEVQRIIKKWQRRVRRVDQQIKTLEPEGAARGEVLFSYIIDPFLLPAGRPLPYSHTHFWESWTMARTFADLGFRVDAVSWVNQSFEPTKDYDVVIDVRQNLERWAPRLPSATKVLHADTAHFTFHNPAQEARHKDLKRRRGAALRDHKMLPENRAAELADCITLLGNDFTQGTYAFAGKPMFRIPISVPFEYPDLEGKDFGAVRKRFLWFGSGGLVHKGLDLVLEAFAGLGEDYHLTVCGPIRREKDFERLYFRELYQTPNIHTYGWIDVGSDAFLDLARRTCGLVYPSCSEGGGGSVLTCMHAGLIPIVNHEVSVDLAPDRGVLLQDASVNGVRQAVVELASRPVDRLDALSKQARAFARQRHTKDGFANAYRHLAQALVSGAWRRYEATSTAHEVGPDGV